MRDLPTRVFSALVLIGALVYLVGFAPNWLFFVFHTIVLALMTWEVSSLCSRLQPIGSRLVPVVAAVIYNSLLFVPEASELACLLGFMLIFLYAMGMNRELPERFQALLLLLFASAYPALLWRPACHLMTQPGGRLFVAHLLIVNFSTDIGAYFGGRLIGRHSLAPKLSPKKTWEGLLSGALLAAVASYEFSWIFLPIPASHAILLGIVIAVVGQLSDLAESLLKRACGAKDSGAIIPGHGGFLDRCDSLFFNIPLAYAYWLWIA